METYIMSLTYGMLGGILVWLVIEIAKRVRERGKS